MVEEVSRQPNIDSVLWSLAITLRQVYKCKKSRQRETQNVQFVEKKSTREFTVTAEAYAKRRK